MHHRVAILSFVLFATVLIESRFVAAEEVNIVATPENSGAIAIVGARLIDGNGGEPIDDSCVIVRANRIEAVGRRADLTIPPDASIVDASGSSILPGLFDSHFHSRDNLNTPITYELNNGVTSFRDPGHPFKYYDLLLGSEKTIPRVFLNGGHLDAEPVVWPDQAVRVASSKDATAAVHSHVDRGASAIKVYFRLPLNHIHAACLAAKSRNVPVTAHLELVDADDAIRAGVIGIEHVTSFGTALADEESAKQFKEMVRADSSARRQWRYRLWQRIKLNDNPRLQPLLNLITDKGVFVSPTLAIFESRADLDGKARAEASDPVKVQAFKNMMRFIRECHRSGAKIVVGSHTSAPFAARGKAYLRETELLVQAGMTPLEVITAATKTNSEFFGVSDRLGTIEPGKEADMVVVTGDPSKRIRDIDRVASVMLNGVWVFQSQTADSDASSR